MAKPKGWVREPRRHSLASRGVKTATNPITRSMSMDRFSGVGDENVAVEEVRSEIEPIIDFLQSRVSDRKEEATLSLDFNYDEFKKFYPDISKKELVNLFDRLDNNRRETYFALEELKKDGKRPNTIIKTVQNL